MGFSSGDPWLPLAAEHAGLSVAAQEADPDSPLAAARALIAWRKASPALRLGEIEFLEVPGPLLAFIRCHGDQAVACVFNLSGKPAVLDHPALAGGALQPLGAGEAEQRGGSLGLSPYAVAFLALSADAD